MSLIQRQNVAAAIRECGGTPNPQLVDSVLAAADHREVRAILYGARVPGAVLGHSTRIVCLAAMVKGPW